MLAWVLLQIHNHHVVDQFFAGIRTSIEKGTFEDDKVAFDRFYEPELPSAKGVGPRYVVLAEFAKGLLTTFAQNPRLPD